MGTLIMAAGTLGRPEDIPARSLQALREADLLVFEEDRPARQLLKAAGVHRDYLKLTEHREEGTIEAVTEALKAGKTVCYMSDQGTPVLADPGRELTAIAHELGARVTAIPGPSSVTAALAACPFDCNSFFVAGFPPREPAERQAWLAAVAGEARAPVVLLDTPYRLTALLDACAAVLGNEREATLALDISGEAEAFWHGTLTQLKQKTGRLEGKLNFVLVLGPSTGSAQAAIGSGRSGFSGARPGSSNPRGSSSDPRGARDGSRRRRGR